MNPCRKRSFIREVTPYVLFAGVIYLVLTYAYNIVYVPTESMAPQIQAKSLCFGLRYPYLKEEKIKVSRGDVVIFWNEEKGKILCKRVIGMPGETVTFENGDVYVDGKLLEQDYASEKHTSFSNRTFRIPEGSVLCLGDNRLHSSDARHLKNPYTPIADLKARITMSISLPTVHFHDKTTEGSF